MGVETKKPSTLATPYLLRDDAYRYSIWRRGWPRLAPDRAFVSLIAPLQERRLQQEHSERPIWSQASNLL